MNKRGDTPHVAPPRRSLLVSPPASYTDTEQGGMHLFIEIRLGMPEKPVSNIEAAVT